MNVRMLYRSCYTNKSDSVTHSSPTVSEKIKRIQEAWKRAGVQEKNHRQLNLQKQLMWTFGKLCDRNTCTHFIKQLPSGISFLFSHELYLNLLPIRVEFSLNIGLSDVLYFVVFLCSLKQMPACEICGSGSRMSRQVVWRNIPNFSRNLQDLLQLKL